MHYSSRLPVDRVAAGGPPGPDPREPGRAGRRKKAAWTPRAGRSVEDLAREFEPCAATIHGWVKQAERDGGRRNDGLTSQEQEELRRLRRENRQLRQERDILAKAAAWFAQSDVTSSRSSHS
jgi:transposase